MIKHRGLFAFAGLWDRWPGNETANPVLSATMVTTKPNELIGTFHHRMPVIVPREALNLWLDAKTQIGEVKKLLVPYPADEMVCEAAARSPRT